jgi:hypothetical protein
MAENERLIPLSELLADPVLVAAADAYVRTDWAHVDPPLWKTFAERDAAVRRSHGDREADQQAYRIFGEAKRFLEMSRAIQAFPHRDLITPRGD